MKQVTQPEVPFLVIDTFSGPNFYQKDEPGKEEEMQVSIAQAMRLDAHECPPGYVKFKSGRTIDFDGDVIPLPPQETITLIHMFPG